MIAFITEHPYAFAAICFVLYGIIGTGVFAALEERDICSDQEERIGYSLIWGVMPLGILGWWLAIGAIGCLRIQSNIWRWMLRTERVTKHDIDQRFMEAMETAGMSDEAIARVRTLVWRAELPRAKAQRRS